MRERWLYILLPVLLCAAVGAAYWPVLGCEFVLFDDDVYVTNNQHVRSGINADSLRWAIALTEEGHDCYWQPLLWLSLMIDYELFGLDAAAFHGMNLALHSLCGVLLFGLLARGTRRPFLSFFASLLWALHPVHVESVAWVAERKNVLSLALGLATLMSYLEFGRSKSRRWYGLSMVMMTLSLLTKPMMVIFPALALLLDRWPLGRLQSKSWRPLLVEKLPFLALAMASVMMTKLSLRPAAVELLLSDRPLTLRVANALVSIPKYLGKLIWPEELAVFYTYPSSVPLWQVGVSVVLLIGLTAGAWALRGRIPALLIGWLWFLVALAPASGISQAGLWPAMADRFVHLPSIGIFIALAWSVDVLATGRRARNIVLLLALLAAGTLGVVTRGQIDHWQNSRALFTRATEISPDSNPMWQNLASVMKLEGDLDNAINVYRRALAIEGRDAKSLRGLAQALEKIGRTQEASEVLAYLKKIEPSSAETQLDLGNLAFGQGRLKDAQSAFEEGLSINPRSGGNHYGLAKTLMAQGKIAEAITHIESSLELNPLFEESHRMHVDLLVRVGKEGEAVEAVRRAIR